MSDEKRDRDPWNQRYAADEDTEETAETSQTAEPSNASSTSKTQESDETSEASKTSKSDASSETSETRAGGSTVRERRNINMYLPDGLVDDLQLAYSELNVEWRREHGKDLPKNQQFYPATVRAALNETSIRAELGLDPED